MQESNVSACTRRLKGMGDVGAALLLPLGGAAMQGWSRRKQARVEGFRLSGVAAQEGEALGLLRLEKAQGRRQGRPRVVEGDWGAAVRGARVTAFGSGGLGERSGDRR